MNSVYIDTSDNKKTIISLERDGVKDTLERNIMPRHGQVVLELLDALLARHDLTAQDIHALYVVPGPGSFTGLRVGITIANTLAHTLHIPINNGEPGKPIEPIYR